MSVERISKRYARSLFGIAEMQQALPIVHADMQMIQQLCRQSLPLRQFLVSPILQEYKKVAVLRALFAKHVHKISMQFIELLARKRREPYLEALAATFVSRYQDHKGIVAAQLSVAHPLSAALKKQFVAYIGKLTAKEPLLDIQIRPELLGGFVLRMGTQQVDKSVASELRTLKKSLLQAPIKPSP